MLPRKHTGRIRIVFDDHRLVANAGLLLPATLARHLGLPQLVDRHLDLGRAPGRANSGDKMMTLVASALAGGDCIDDADVLRSGGTASVIGGTVKAPSTPAFARAGSGHLPAQLPLGPCPPVGPGELGTAGPGLCGWGGTRRRTPDHRSRFDHLRDLRPGQGGGPPPRLHRPAGLSPAAGPAAGGPRQHRPGRWTLPARDGGTGALRRGHGATHPAGRQRLLYPRRGRRLPQDEGPLLHHCPPAPEPAPCDRGHTRGGLEAHSYWTEGAADVAETVYRACLRNQE